MAAIFAAFALVRMPATKLAGGAAGMHMHH
jgi:hypothetical protein